MRALGLVKYNKGLLAASLSPANRPTHDDSFYCLIQPKKK